MINPVESGQIRAQAMWGELEKISRSAPPLRDSLRRGLDSFREGAQRSATRHGLTYQRTARVAGETAADQAGQIGEDITDAAIRAAEQRVRRGIDNLGVYQDTPPSIRQRVSQTARNVKRGLIRGGGKEQQGLNPFKRDVIRKVKGDDGRKRYDIVSKEPVGVGKRLRLQGVRMADWAEKNPEDVMLLGAGAAAGAAGAAGANRDDR